MKLDPDIHSSSGWMMRPRNFSSSIIIRSKFLCCELVPIILSCTSAPVFNLHCFQVLEVFNKEYAHTRLFLFLHWRHRSIKHYFPPPAVFLSSLPTVWSRFTQQLSHHIQLNPEMCFITDEGQPTLTLDPHSCTHAVVKFGMSHHWGDTIAPPSHPPTCWTSQ